MSSWYQTAEEKADGSFQRSNNAVLRLRRPLPKINPNVNARRTLAEVDYGFSEEADTVPPTPTKKAAAAAMTSAAGGEAAMFAKLKADGLHLASEVASLVAPVSETMMPTIAETGAATKKKTATTIVEFDEPLRKQPTMRGVTNDAELSDR